MKFSSDVNVIFAYDDITHLFHKPVFLYLAKNKRCNYLLLSKTKSTFIYTYKNYLETCCNIIDKAIREEKKKRSKSPSKTYKPSTLVISMTVEKSIDKYIAEQKSIFLNFSEKAVRKFIALLLTDCSIPELYENDESFANFREKYLIKSEEQALDILNRFLRIFNGFHCMNIEDYQNYDSWLDKIKSSKKNIFENKKDYEDMKLAAEFLAFNQEIGLLNICTCDDDFSKSIPIIAKDHSQRIGRVHLFTSTA